MNITVIGGGNIGTLMAAEMAHKGHAVTVYTSRPERWSRELQVYDPDDTLLLTGTIARLTHSMEEALREAELVWITLPAQLFSQTAASMLPFARAGLRIGMVPGSGGAEFAFRPLIQKGCVLFGLQRVHSIARLKEYGHSVYMLGRKSELQIGSIPCGESESLCRMTEGLFDIPCRELPNYLSVTLTPSNPILHTTRLYSMFRDYRQGTVYPRNFLFYEEWTDASSQALIACDEELQALCRRIPLDLRNVKSLREHYESYDVPSMTAKISGIPAFRGLTSPMKQTETGWVPDFSSRYFTADFSYGLKILLDMAGLFEEPAPYMRRVWDWYAQVSPEDAESAFSIPVTREECVELYSTPFQVV